MDMTSFLIGYKKGMGSGGSGGGTGGGSSLPASIYWQQDNVILPNGYRQVMFMLNGSLYAWTITATGPLGSSTINVYKFVDDAWKQVVTSNDIGIYGYTPVPVEFNGKAHFIGEEQNRHFTYDETNGVVQLANMPNKISKKATFVQDGKLKCYSYYDGNVYVWDETSDTWTVESLIGSKYVYLYANVVGETVYMGKQKTMCRYENGALEQVGTTVELTGESCVIGKRIYYASHGSAKGTLYAYDTETGENIVLGNMPAAAMSAYRQILNTFGQLRMCSCDYSASGAPKYSLVMYEVEGDAANG